MPVADTGPAALFGWLLTIAGIVYILLGSFGSLTGAPGAVPRFVVGIAAVVVGSSVVRWARRRKPDR